MDTSVKKVLEVAAMCKQRAVYHERELIKFKELHDRLLKTQNVLIDELKYIDGELRA